MSAWSRCGQPKLWQTPCFHSMFRGICGHAFLPRRSGFTAAQMSMKGCPTISTCLPTGDFRTDWAIRLSFEPGTRWSTSTPTRRSGPGPKSRSFSPRSSTPSRYSTTTPSIRRSSPQTFSTSSASCRPSTKIRLARATRALVPCTAIDPDAVRVGADRALTRRRDQHDRASLEQETGTERERAPLVAAVLEGHRAEVALDLDDLADPVGGDLLDDQAEVGVDLDRAAVLGDAPVGGEDVGAVAVETGGGGRHPRTLRRERVAGRRKRARARSLAARPLRSEHSRYIVNISRQCR